MKHVNKVAFCLFFMYLTNQPLVCIAQDDGFVMGAVDQVTSDPSTKVFKLSSGFVSSTINSFKEYSKINDGILENINKLSPKLAKAQELNNNYKESLLKLYGNDIVDDFTKMNDLQKKLDKTQGIIQNTTDEISLSKKEMYKLEAFLDEKLKTIEGTKFEKGLGAVGKGADYAGKFLDVLDVINSADTIFNDDVGKLEKVEAGVSILSTTMSNFSKTFVKASGGGLVLFDTTMAVTELYLDGSRDVAQQLIDIMQKDIDQFYSLRRKVIANAVIANEGKSPKEIEDIANYEVGVLANQFMDRYSSNGQIYKSVFGHGISKLAAGSGHLTTGGSDIDTFNRCLNIFSENLISSEKNKTYITSRVGAVSSQLAEIRVAAKLMEDELDNISDGLTSITNQKIKAVNEIKNIQKSNIAQKEAFQTNIAQLEKEFTQEQQTVNNANGSAQLNSIDAKQNTNKQVNNDNVQKEDVGSNIQSAEKLKQENLLLASKVGNLLRQLNSPTLSKEQQNELNLELKTLSTKLNENAQAYLDLRKEIRKTDPTFGSLIDTVGTVTSRVGLELQNQLEEKEKEQQANRLAVEEKIKRINQANRENKDELEALKNSISRMEQEKRSKQQELRTLQEKQTSGQNNNSRYQDDIKELEYRIDQLNTVKKVKEVMKNKGLSTGDLSDKVIEKLKDIASQLGINWRKMLITSDSLYKTELKKLETLKIKSHYSQNNGGLSSSEKSRLRELARDIESLNDDIAYTSNKIKKIKDSLNKNISNYNDYTRSLASLDNLIKNEWNRTTSTLNQLSQWFQLNTNQENSVQDAKEDPGFISSQISRTNVSGNSVYPEPASNSSSSESIQIQSTPEDSEEENLWGWGSVVGSSTIVAGSYTYATPRIMGPGAQLDHTGSTTEIEVDDVNGTFNVNYDYGSYNYVAWGRWNGGASTVYHESGHDPFDDVDGHWVHGETLGADEIPTSGTATYNGELIGGYVNHGTGTVEPNSITGTMNLTAIFSNGGTGIAGGMNLNRNGVPWAVTHFNSANARAAGDDYFRADMTVVDGGVGDIIGSFYGPNGEEIGGAFMVDKQSGDWGGAAGVFRAKK